MKSKINQGKVSAKRKKFRVWEGGGGTEEKIRGIARPPTPKKQHKNGIKTVRNGSRETLSRGIDEPNEPRPQGGIYISIIYYNHTL